jgi:Cys-tRNA synthase (O-phospho-L-seryl-tRNA:Cys-tRNA synthase)
MNCAPPARPESGPGHRDHRGTSKSIDIESIMRNGMDPNSAKQSTQDMLSSVSRCDIQGRIDSGRRPGTH